MPHLILLNGAPASGKSTVARRLIATRPLALNLDVDVVRGALGGWLDRPHEAGLAARRLALAMAATHLADGHDVIVPQLLMHDTFVRELEAVAATADAGLVEIALIVDRATITRAFAARSASPEHQQHRDADELVSRSGDDDAVGQMHDRLMEFLATRPSVQRVQVLVGDIDSTVRLVEAAIAVER